MCGIAGWIDYARDLTRERATLEAMTRTMENRGPDAEGFWLCSHAALGHRRLAIIDLQGGRQPMIVEADGQPLAVLDYTGEVYNFRELRAELVSLGHRFRTESDTEVVLHAYLQWGHSFPERLNGMYAFALWDVRAQELLLVRDRFGIKPLYYQPTDSGVLFGSEPKALLANPLCSPVVDADGLRELFTLKTPGLTVFRDMREVRPGHVVHVSQKGLFERRYWALQSRPHTDDLPTTIRTVRELLEDIVTRQLISDVPLCTLLSGGLDSSLLTAFAQTALQRQGAGPVRSFSVDFVEQARNFQADDARTTLDAPYVEEMVKYIGSQHSNIVLSATELADPAVRSVVLRCRDYPQSFGDQDASFYLLCQAIRKHSTVALSGESADEVFGGYLWFHDDAAIEAATFPWIAMRSLVHKPGTVPSLLDPGFLKQLGLFGYVDQRYREAIAEVPQLPGEVGRERRMREVFYLHLTRFLQVLLDRKDRIGMAAGLEVRVPFCDHRLVEYVFNTPWSMKTFDGREKSLLRAAAASALPQSVLERRKNPYPVTQDPAYSEQLRSQFAELLADPSAPVRPFLDLDQARAAAGADAESAQRFRLSTWQALIFNDWLRQYKITLKL